MQLKPLLILSLFLFPAMAQEKSKPGSNPVSFELSAEGKKAWADLLQTDKERQAAQAEIDELLQRLVEAHKKRALLNENLTLKLQKLQADEQAKTCGDCVLTNDGKLMKPPKAK